MVGLTLQVTTIKLVSRSLRAPVARVYGSRYGSNSNLITRIYFSFFFLLIYIRAFKRHFLIGKQRVFINIYLLNLKFVREKNGA